MIARTLLVTCALAASARAETLDLSSRELIAQGAVSFAKNCAVGYCHGTEGRAARGPALRERRWDPRKLFGQTWNGVPDTSMPAWKSILPEQEVWAIAAYVLSLSTEPPVGDAAVVELGTAAEAAARKPLGEEARRGREIFFDLTNERRCSLCHELEGQGNPMGPNLAFAARGKSPEELRRDIKDPNADVAYGFEQAVVTTKLGERVVGVLKGRDDDALRIYDIGALPPPLRTFYRGEFEGIESRAKSSMPSDYGDRLSGSELSALVAYLRAL